MPYFNMGAGEMYQARGHFGHILSTLISFNTREAACL